ncbi:MAG: glycine zipper 2TM domain-containing protein [Sphingomonadales bacterium]|nr:glycine zipper 2TM domain-containing protein [Sphingomonadales bacterium]
MKKLIFAGVASSAMMLAIAPASAAESFSASSKARVSSTVDLVANGKNRGGHGVNMGHGARMGHGMRGHGVRMGHNPVHGRWHGGMRAPGGYAAYRAPFRGFILPSYWINPGFSVPNYSYYGLTAPANGYYWSRYYDDAVLMNNRGYVYDSVPNVNWAPQPSGYAPQAGYPQADYGPAIDADDGVYSWGEDADDPRTDGTTEAGTYEGAWTGRYVDEERRTYRGQWDGTYTDDDGRVYEGSYRGTAVGDPVYRTGAGAAPAAGAPYPYPSSQPYPAPVSQGYPDDGYDIPGGYERYEQCLKGRGLTGGAIGAILGGIAGNRIAGRGDRLAGTLIGGGIGAIAGAGIEKATNKCKKYLPQQQVRPQYYPQQPAYYPYPQTAYPVQPYAYGWQGYYYPQQSANVTTVTITPGTATTTTTVTEEVIYEDVYSAPVARKGKGLRRPAASTKKCRC